MARKGDATIAGALRCQGLRVGALVRRASEQNESIVVRRENAADKFDESFPLPAPLRQHVTGIGVNQHQPQPCRITPGERPDFRIHPIARRGAQGPHRKCELLVADDGLRIGNVGTLLKSASIRAMKFLAIHAMCQHIAAVQAFIVEPVETNPAFSAGQSREQCRKARKQLASSAEMRVCR